jgi:hypothetical protein
MTTIAPPASMNVLFLLGSSKTYKYIRGQRFVECHCHTLLSLFPLEGLLLHSVHLVQTQIIGEAELHLRRARVRDKWQNASHPTLFVHIGRASYRPPKLFCLSFSMK